MRVKNLIIDGTNIEFRIFYVSKELKMTNEAGEQTSCVYKFLASVKNLIEQFNPDDVYFAWDRRLTWPSTNFRQTLLEDQYKAGRVKPPDIDEMYAQEVKLIEGLEMLGCKHMFPNTLEADDVVAWLARNLEGPNVIVSVDHDLLQLIDDKNSMYDLKSTVTKNNFTEEVGVEPQFFKLYKAIMGDTSDNIPGIPGYGKVRSRKLAQQWSTANVTEDVRKIVERNLKLIDLDYGYVVQPEELKSYKDQFEYLKGVKGDINKFKEFCQRNGFTKYVENFSEWKHLFDRNKLVELINANF